MKLNAELFRVGDALSCYSYSQSDSVSIFLIESIEIINPYKFNLYGKWTFIRNQTHINLDYTDTLTVKTNLNGIEFMGQFNPLGRRFFNFIGKKSFAHLSNKIRLNGNKLTYEKLIIDE